MLIALRVRRAFAQGASDYQSGTFVSTIVLTLSFYTCLSFQKSTVHSVFWLEFRSPVIFSHQFSAQSTFFCKNLKQRFSCCSNNCFLFVQRAREAASPGASWPVNRCEFDSGGAPFFEAVFGTHFFTQKSHTWSKMIQKVTHLKVFRESFKKNIQN